MTILQNIVPLLNLCCFYCKTTINGWIWVYHSKPSFHHINEHLTSLERTAISPDWTGFHSHGFHHALGWVPFSDSYDLIPWKINLFVTWGEEFLANTWEICVKKMWFSNESGHIRVREIHIPFKFMFNPSACVIHHNFLTNGLTSSLITWPTLAELKEW
jgi:hypothetical protein